MASYATLFANLRTNIRGIPILEHHCPLVVYTVQILKVTSTKITTITAVTMMNSAKQYSQGENSFTGREGQLK